MVGEILRIRYELLEEVGKTPIFTLFRARDRVSGRESTIRLFNQPFSGEGTFVAAVGEWVEMVRRISHPGIERMIELDEDEGRPFLVSEVVTGQSLADRIARLAPFSPPVAIGTCIRVCEAVVPLHAAGIMHGDLGPGNVIVAPDNSIKLMHGGLWETFSRSQFAGASMLGDLAPSLAPEITKGALPTAGSDVYAIGVLLFQLLTGKPPFTGETPMAIALSHATQPTPSPRELNPAVPEVLDNIALRAMDRDPQNRYPTVAALLSDLRTLQDALRFGKTVTWPLNGEAPAKQPIAPKLSALQAETKPAKASKAAKAPEPEEMEEALPPDVPRWLSGLVYLAVIALLSLAGAWLYFNYNAPRLAQMPDVVGLSLTDAKSRLEPLNLNIRVSRREPNDRLPEGSIVAVSPAPGDQVREGSTVAAVVSAGSQFVETPDLRGRTLDDARTLLEALDLRLADPPATEYSRDVPEGQILAQVPERGRRIERGTEVRVTLSRASRRGDRAEQDLRTYQFNLQVRLPADTPSVLLRVDMTDARETRTIFEERRVMGDVVEIEARGAGPEATFRIFYDGELIKQVTHNATGEASQ